MKEIKTYPINPRIIQKMSTTFIGETFIHYIKINHKSVVGFALQNGNLKDLPIKQLKM